MKRILLLIILLAGFVIKAQPPTKFFTKFGGAGIDIAYSAQETYNRQYIILGSTTSFGFGSADAYLTLVDSMGQLVWSKNYGGAQADVGKSIIINPVDSGFVFTGYTGSYGSGGYDIYVVRTDKEGNLKWQSTFGGTDWDFGTDIDLASDGNVVVCGNSYSNKYGKSDGFVLKINISTGQAIWQKYYGGSEDDDFRSIVLTSDGNYSIGGNTKSYGDLNNDFWLFKVNNLGDSVTSSKLGNPNKAEMCYDMMEDNFNNLIFCGSYDTSAYNTGKNDCYLIKTNITGTFISEVRFTGAGSNDKFLSATKSSLGNNFCFSRSVYKPSFAIEAQPFLVDFNFNYISSTTYADVNDEEAFNIINTTDDGYLMVGYTKSYNSISEDVFLVKLDNTLLNSANIVGLKEVMPFKNKQPEIYYSEGKVYFENLKKENLSYELINSRGVIITKDNTRENNIHLNTELSGGIYIIKISNLPSLKFIKE